jgi:hypothetical protein
MRQVHCDGCGFVEAANLPEPRRKIRTVTLDIVNDKRWQIGTDKHSADLCPGCISLMLSSYFKVPADDRIELEIPSWLEREDLQEEILERSS